MSDDEESPTISGAEMAARFGMTEDEFMASIAENDLRKQLEIVVNIDDLEHGTWFASCGACARGILVGAPRQSALAAARRHNGEVHGGALDIDDQIGGDIT